MLLHDWGFLKERENIKEMTVKGRQNGPHNLRDLSCKEGLPFVPSTIAHPLLPSARKERKWSSWEITPGLYLSLH